MCAMDMRSGDLAAGARGGLVSFHTDSGRDVLQMAYEAADDVTNVEWDDVPSTSRRLYDIAHRQASSRR
jgi:hypothetical protein